MEKNNYSCDIFKDGRKLEIEHTQGIFECYLDKKLVAASSRIEPILLVLLTGLKNYFYLVSNPEVEFQEIPNFPRKDYCLSRAFDFIDDQYDLDDDALYFRRLMNFDPSVELLNLDRFGRPGHTCLKFPNSTGGEDILTFEIEDYCKNIQFNDTLLIGSMCYTVPLFAFLAIMNIPMGIASKVDFNLAFENLSNQAVDMLSELYELNDLLNLDETFRNYILSNLNKDNKQLANN